MGIRLYKGLAGIAVVLTAMAGTIPVIAQTRSGDRLGDETFSIDGDVATIIACLSNTSLALDPATCIGGVSKACIAEDGNDTTVGMMQCLGREKAAWDVLLNQSYRHVLLNLSPTGQRALRLAQRRWLATRQADLAVFSHSEGSIQLLHAASYDMTVTAQRTIHLRSMKEGD